MDSIVFGRMNISFFILVIVLLIFGLLMMYSASYAWAINEGLAPNYYFLRQSMMAAGGIAAMLIIASPLVDYHFLGGRTVVAIISITCAVLMVTVILRGIIDKGASRWLGVGELFSFQPSELTKMGLVILFAYLLSKKYEKPTLWNGIFQYLFILGTVAVLMLAQPHISGTIIICCIGVVMMFVGGVKLRYLLPSCIIGVAALTGVVIFLYKSGYDYIIERMIAWQHTFEPEYKEIAWQTKNSLIAIGSGGLLGLGLGNSRQKFLYLPEAKNDFVFSIICEELGFCGAVVVILLFLALIFCGFSIAANAPDKFGMLLTTGIVMQIGIQALLNIAVVSNAIPNTGISLPFFSYGGTALIMQLAEMGVVLNISRQSIPRKGKPDSDNAAEAERRQVEEAKRHLGNISKTKREIRGKK